MAVKDLVLVAVGTTRQREIPEKRPKIEI